MIGMLTLAGLAFGAATAYFKGRAFRLYHGGWFHTQRSLQAPASVAEHARQLDRDLSDLQRLQPGLARVERKYLGQPLDETQSLLYLLGMQALKNKEPKKFELISHLLNEIWLQERDASQLDVDRVQTLNRFQQRILAFYASSALQRGKASLPSVDPKAWAGRLSLGHRLLLNHRVKQWHEWEVWGGLTTWREACDVLERLDRWHQELETGKVLSPPSPQLKSLYEALLPLQTGP
ncbi:hypothetical protein IV102_11670 [bacterium]|nr:hypothetical protein [bacterium]